MTRSNFCRFAVDGMQGNTVNARIKLILERI